jgi:hypothetical protein
MHLSRQYTRFSGLDQLIALNEKGGLTDSQKAEFRDKYYTASAIAAFCTSYYVVSELSGYKTDAVGNVQLDFAGIPEIALRNPVEALDCIVFYYAAYLERSGAVTGNDEFLKLTLLYFHSVIDEIELRRESFKYVEPFTAQTYLLQGSDFRLSGFDTDLSKEEVSIEFNRVELSQIVGNKSAKHMARRLAERLICYDAQEQKNPFFELGGLSPVTMGYGEPGTGKSMLIAAIATLLNDYSKLVDIPFLFWPMPDTVVSTFQGGSAERMLNWMKPLRDPGKIIYAPIDDAENNLEERTRQGVSAGVREVIGVFLRNTEGAYAIQRGNTLIQLLTNIPDQIDRAVLSRINERIYIGGAQTREDFLDQDHLWWRKYNDIDPDFVSLSNPVGYEFLREQANLRSLSQVYDGNTSPDEERIHAIYEKITQKHSSDSHDLFAALYTEVKRSYPYFTSRDVRNIQRAIDSRMMDFDLPEQWLEDPELFFQKDYSSKYTMVVDLMKQNMKGLSFAEVRLQETVRYLDNMATISESGRERRIDETVTSIEIQQEALKRVDKDS